MSKRATRSRRIRAAQKMHHARLAASQPQDIRSSSGSAFKASLSVVHLEPAARPRCAPSRFPGGRPPNWKEYAIMASQALSSHLEALTAKHAGLEARLREEMARPIPDAGTLQALKKQKLRLKEEIARA